MWKRRTKLEGTADEEARVSREGLVSQGRNLQEETHINTFTMGLDSL